MSIIGLDLAGVETRPTGFCILVDMNVETCVVYTNKEIVEKTLKSSPRLVAIYAPYVCRQEENYLKKEQATT